jgi:DNA-binding NarL/FixJ family response regulator
MSLRILLVDDHQMMREGLRRVLEAAGGIEVVGEAEDGSAAVEAVERHRPDVVVMDVAMKGMNGIDATQAVLRRCPGARVVALSTYADKRYVQNMVKAGVVGYVLKESASDDLLRAVRAAAAGEHYFSPRVAGCLAEGLVAPRKSSSGSAYDVLGPREREVLKLLAEGRTSKQIALALELSVKTVETHRRNITQKVGLRSVAELTKYAVREGLTTLE